MSFFMSTRLVVFMLVGGNLCDIIAALGFCHNVAVCGKLKIGSFNSSAGKLQLLGTLAERRLCFRVSFSHPGSVSGSIRKLPYKDA